MELFNNFKSLFLSVWERGILGVDILQILIGVGIFLIFLIFRGIISKLIIKRLENIAKRTTNKFDDSFVSVTVSTYLVSWKSGDMKSQAFLYLCRPN